MFSWFWFGHFNYTKQEIGIPYFMGVCSDFFVYRFENQRKYVENYGNSRKRQRLNFGPDCGKVLVVAGNARKDSGG